MPKPPINQQALLQLISDYVDTHLGDKLTLQHISAHFGVSVSTITQMFQRQATTFHSLLTQRRLDAAKALIQEGVPLEQVGRQVGYTDHSSFYRAFRQHCGVSPRQFRRMHSA